MGLRVVGCVLSVCAMAAQPALGFVAPAGAGWGCAAASHATVARGVPAPSSRRCAPALRMGLFDGIASKVRADAAGRAHAARPVVAVLITRASVCVRSGAPDCARSSRNLWRTPPRVLPYSTFL